MNRREFLRQAGVSALPGARILSGSTHDPGYSSPPLALNSTNKLYDWRATEFTSLGARAWISMRDNHQKSAPSAPPDEQAGRTPVAALRHRDFSIYWSGSVISLVGSQFTTVAMAWQIYELTNSPLQLGLLGLARGAPMLVLLLFGGVPRMP